MAQLNTKMPLKSGGKYLEVNFRRMGDFILQKQNESDSLLLLGAQRRLYSKAKQCWTVQIIVVVVTPAALVITELIHPISKELVAFFGLCIAILDSLVFDEVKSSFRRHAARIQELFDCRVLQLPWPALKSSMPDLEDVRTYAEGVERKPLRDWYPASISSLPFDAARLVCQRSNCRWDCRLRCYFKRFLIGVATVLTIVCVGIGYLKNLHFNDLLLGVLVPLLPVILWSIRESRAQSEAAERATRLKDAGQEAWRKLRSGELADCAAESRRLQDEMFEHRASSPLVFDWFYGFFQNRLESEMNYSAEQMAKEFLESHAR